jgi:hypothetical protein
MEAVELILRIDDQLRKRLSKVLKFAACQDPRRLSRCGINTMRIRAPLPGGRYFVVGRQWVPLRNREYPLDMSSRGVGMPQWLRMGRMGHRSWAGRVSDSFLSSSTAASL